MGQKLAPLRPYLDLPEGGGLPAAMDALLSRHPLSRLSDVAGLEAFTQWLFAAVTNGNLDHRQGGAQP